MKYGIRLGKYALSVLGAATLISTGISGVSLASGIKASTSLHNHAAVKRSLAPITIGVISPFSGGEAFIGQLNNAQTYPSVSLINKAGGILGHQIVIKDVDTKNDPADALPATEQFLATNSNVLMVMAPQTTEAPTLAPVFNRDKIIMWSGAGEASFDHSTMPYFWRGLYSDPANGMAMAMWAKREGWTRIATVFGSDGGSQGDLPGVLQGLKKVPGMKLVTSLNVTPDQPSYKAQVARLLNSKPQAIFTEEDPTTGATFFGELQQQEGASQHIRVIVTATGGESSWTGPVEAAMGKSNFLRAFSAVSFQAPAPNPATKLFDSALLSQASNVPNPSQFLGFPGVKIGFDGLTTIALAAVEANSINPTVVDKYVMDVANPGKGKQTVYSFAEGVKLIHEGKKIRYVGSSGGFIFDKYHNSSGNQVAIGMSPSGASITKWVITNQMIANVG